VENKTIIKSNIINNQQVQVGIGVLILRGNEVLLGKRISGHNKNTWQSTGGHLEFGESFENCARREILEETRIKVKNIRQITTTNDIFVKDKKHYVTIFMACDYVSGNAKAMEPEKCSQWQWFPKDKLPKNLFLPYNKILSLIKDD